MSEENIDKKFNMAMENVNNLQKVFRTSGVLHNMVSEVGGDVSWFNDVNEAFDNLYEALEEAHMGSVAHLQMQKDESKNPEPVQWPSQPIEEDKECGPGEYYCRTDKKCKPIPEGYKVMPDGELVQETAEEESGIDKKLVGDLNLILQRSGL